MRTHGHLRGDDANPPHLALTGGVYMYAAMGRYAVNCNASGRSTREPLSDVGGRAVIPSGKYPKQELGNRFQLLSSRRTAGVVIPFSLCQAGGITERSPCSRVDVGCCSGNQWDRNYSSTRKTSVTTYSGSALRTERSPDKIGDRR